MGKLLLAVTSALFLVSAVLAQDYDDVFFYKKDSMRIKNIGRYSAQQASMQCARKGLRWIAIMNEEINDIVRGYMIDNGLDEAWLGLIQTMGGSARWIGLGESSDKYNNWAPDHPQPGYIYIEAATGQWKSVFTMEEKPTLCMERKRFCEKEGRKIVLGDRKEFGNCENCTCSSMSIMKCDILEDCKPKKDGCIYQNQVIAEGDDVTMGCRHCVCKKESGVYSFQCTSCDLIDVTSGTAHETVYRLQQQCPPKFANRGYAWVKCSDTESLIGCDKSCESTNEQCGRRCTPRCACPPSRPFQSHGFCVEECPGRRYAPIIIEGLSNRVYPEGEEFTVRCTAIGEPAPLVTISEYDFDPALDQQPNTGDLGLSFKSKTFRAVPGVTPNKLTCFAWNINGVTKSSSTIKVVSRDDSSSNPVAGANGEIHMPPMVRLGIENLVLSTKYGQRMKCIVTGAPKPEVIIVKLHEGSLLPTVKAYAEPGIHDVVVEVIVMIDAKEKAGRYACLAANKYGAVKDFATLGFIEKAPTPSEAAMVMKAANFIKDASALSEWPFEPQDSGCSYEGKMHNEGAQFKKDCNVCTCIGGKIRCTNDMCSNVAAQKECKDNDGKTYGLYQSWKQDCNTCTCLKDGRTFCTSKKCKKAVCYHNGKKVMLGEVVADDCNKCICQSNGEVRCSTNQCDKKKEEKADNSGEEKEADKPKPTGVQCVWFGGARYNVGETFMHGCKKCYCHESGRPVCNDDSACGKVEKQCQWKGKALSIGAVFRDNCQTCMCNNVGKVDCQGEPCPSETGCSYKEKNYNLRQRFKDDCNVCMCLKGGLVMCSQNPCEAPKDPCTFQFQTVKHGTQKQVECNLCTCNDGNMSCTKNRCPGADLNDKREGCRLEGEWKKYRSGSVIQIGNKLCKCQLDPESRFAKVGERIMNFVCDGDN